MPVQRVSDMEFDEISTVDIPANQYGVIAIAKRATQEDTVPDDFFEFDPEGEYYDPQSGERLDNASIDYGSVIATADGQTFLLEDESADERELATVGKSAFFQEPAANGSVLAGIRSELEKSLNQADSGVLAKALDAFEAIEKRAALAEQRSDRLEQIAKREREIRLEREYIAKAADYNVPIPPDELGPVLMRAAEALSYDDCAVLHKALTASGEMLFTEAGYSGRGEQDPFQALQDELEDAEIAKSGERSPISKEARLTAFLDANPDEYARHRAERNNR